MAAREVATLSSSPIFRDGTELGDRMLRTLPLLRMHETMIDVIVDQRALRAGDCILYRLKLLRYLNASSLILDHADDATHVTGGTIETLDDGGVRRVNMGH